MSELRVHEFESDEEANAFSQLAEHWGIYYGQPETERLGQEETWSKFIIGCLIEKFGITRSQACELNQIAQFEAQMPNDSLE